jgi:hypothetical protein
VKPRGKEILKRTWGRGRIWGRTMRYRSQKENKRREEKGRMGIRRR